MIQTTALILGAVVVAGLTFVIGLALGLLTSECYKGKRICRECMRSFVEHGFHVDGAEYVCTKREG